MVICPDCGKEVPDAKFCKNCGAHLPEVTEAVRSQNIGGNNVIDVNADVMDDTQVKKPHFCFNCGYELNGEFKFCPNCGYDLVNKSSVTSRSSNNSVVRYEEKNIILSIILSVIFPGLGQFYLGLNRKGTIFLLTYIISAILVLLIIGFLLAIVIWIWALVDVIQSTNAINRGEVVEDKLF